MPAGGMVIVERDCLSFICSFNAYNTITFVNVLVEVDDRRARPSVRRVHLSSPGRQRGL